ncbi:MAG: SIR2 family protein [Solirubrobacterales bacterium]
MKNGNGREAVGRQAVQVHPMNGSPATPPVQNGAGDMPGSKQTKASITRLADMLMARHVRVATPDSMVRVELSEDLNNSLELPELVERDMHCVAIVGAGASAPLVDRANDLADELEERFERDETELNRLSLVYGSDIEHFETRLIALSKNPETMREVRKTISEKYSLKHPTLLGYELLAHLLKHRFIDAIISCNFDELLDRSLDDELDASEYKHVISERDCNDLQLDPSATDYVPLYVKLHGTASEPDSLRFTPDSYYSIPDRISNVVRELLHAEHCVVANVGSGLATFDLQQVLGIPRKLDVFNLSLEPVEQSVSRKIDEVRKSELPEIDETDGTARRRQSNGKPEYKSTVGKWLHECQISKYNCDNLLKVLTDTLRCRAARGDSDSDCGNGGLVRFRSVRRHEVVADLLGPETVTSRSTVAPQWAEPEAIEYTRRRTILELALAGAKARGLLQLGPLVLDRPARYFDDFRRLTKGTGESWAALCAAAGLDEGQDNPDVLVSREDLRPPDADAVKSVNERDRPDTQALNRFDPEALAQHVMARVKNANSNDVLMSNLRDTFDEIQNESEIELHMRDDRVCSKAFRRPMTLPTATSLEAYTRLLLNRIGEGDHVYISSETADWMLRDDFMPKLERAERIHLLLAFDTKRKALCEAYGRKKLKVTTIDPWRHSRHMRVVCKGDTAERAIYFARRARNPVITAVYLDDISDVLLLRKLYVERWNESYAEERHREKR